MANAAEIGSKIRRGLPEIRLPGRKPPEFDYSKFDLCKKEQTVSAEKPESCAAAVVNLTRERRREWQKAGLTLAQIKPAQLELRLLDPQPNNQWQETTILLDGIGRYIAHQGEEEPTATTVAPIRFLRYVEIMFRRGIVSTDGEFFRIEIGGRDITSSDTPKDLAETPNEIFQNLETTSATPPPYLGRRGTELSVQLADHQAIFARIQMGVEKRITADYRLFSQVLAELPLGKVLNLDPDTIEGCFGVSPDVLLRLSPALFQIYGYGGRWESAHRHTSNFYMVELDPAHPGVQLVRRLSLRDRVVRLEQFIEYVDKKKNTGEIWAEDQNPLHLLNFLACFRTPDYTSNQRIVAVTSNHSFAPTGHPNPQVVADIPQPLLGAEELFGPLPDQNPHTLVIAPSRFDPQTQKTAIATGPNLSAGREPHEYEKEFATLIRRQAVANSSSTTSEGIFTDPAEIEAMYRAARLSAEEVCLADGTTQVLIRLAILGRIPSTLRDRIADITQRLMLQYPITKGTLPQPLFTGLTDFRQTRTPDEFALPKKGYLGFQVSAEAFKLLGIRLPPPRPVEPDPDAPPNQPPPLPLPVTLPVEFKRGPSIGDTHTLSFKVPNERTARSIVDYDPKDNQPVKRTFAEMLFIANLFEALTTPSFQTIYTLAARKYSDSWVIALPYKDMYEVVNIRDQKNGTYLISDDSEQRVAGQNARDQALVILHQYMEGEYTFDATTRTFKKPTGLPGLPFGPSQAGVPPAPVFTTGKPERITLAELPQLYEAAVLFWKEQRFNQLTTPLHAWIGERQEKPVIATLDGLRTHLHAQVFPDQSVPKPMLQPEDSISSRLVSARIDEQKGILVLRVRINNPFNKQTSDILIEVDNVPGGTGKPDQSTVDCFHQARKLGKANWQEADPISLQPFIASAVLSQESSLDTATYLKVRDDWVSFATAKGRALFSLMGLTMDAEGHLQAPYAGIYIPAPPQKNAPPNSPRPRDDSTEFSLKTVTAKGVTRNFWYDEEAAAPARPVEEYCLERLLWKTPDGYVDGELLKKILEDIKTGKEWETDLKKAINDKERVFFRHLESERGSLTAAMVIAAIDEEADVRAALRQNKYWENISKLLVNGKGIIHTTLDLFPDRSIENTVIYRHFNQKDRQIFLVGHHVENTTTHVEYTKGMNYSATKRMHVLFEKMVNGKKVITYGGVAVVNPLNNNIEYIPDILDLHPKNIFIASHHDVSTQRSRLFQVTHPGGSINYMQGSIDVMRDRLWLELCRVRDMNLKTQLKAIPPGKRQMIRDEILARILELPERAESYTFEAVYQAWANRLFEPYEEFVATGQRETYIKPVAW